MEKKMAESETIKHLRESGAMLEGHFLLSSGLHSNRYFQCARLLQYPDRAAAALAPLVARLKAAMASGELQLDALVGPAMGGIVVAYELGRQLGLPAFFTERDDQGAMSLRRGFEVHEGQRIMITEDVVTTGKSSLETASILEALGAKVVALSCIVDRRAAKTPVAWPLYGATEVQVETWESASCPLCAQGLPAIKPGSRKLFK